jgi:integrase
MTFSQLCAAYLAYLAKKSTYKAYVRLHEQYFKVWTAHPSRQEIRSWHISVQETPCHANKGMGFLRAMYNWAINEGKWEGENPAASLHRHKTQARDRVMASFELKTLLQALDFTAPKFAGFLTVLLTTACRMSEARYMKWEHIDLIHGVWFKPTTKNGRSQRLPLPRQACEAITALPREGQYVFPGHYGQCWSRAGVEKTWGQFRKLLRMDDVTLHDFRRTVASRLYAQEKDLMLVKACLNHYDGSPTAVYVRLQYDRLAEALQLQADTLFALAAPKAQDGRSLRQNGERGKEATL